MTITEFLLARIAEDEAAANHARWAMQDEWFTTAEDKVDEFVRHNSPARVLAECAAKRAIVERYAYLLEHGDSGDVAWVLPQLAAVHSDHPDYDQEWKP